jgi:hypothetical protein
MNIGVATDVADVNNFGRAPAYCTVHYTPTPMYCFVLNLYVYIPGMIQVQVSVNGGSETIVQVPLGTL